jgi:hypothetical protein
VRERTARVSTEVRDRIFTRWGGNQRCVHTQSSGVDKRIDDQDGLSRLTARDGLIYRIRAMTVHVV